MPAISVDDVLVLPRLPEPDSAVSVDRPVRSITTAPRGLEGEGFPVRRAFAGVAFADLDPFIHMDEMGTVDWEPGAAKGTAWHPHRGFETVTYMVTGRMRHRDNRGNQGDLGPGSVQWMTAARGIVHEEMPQQQDGLLWGYQLWVNLPASEKLGDPVYQDIPAEQIPEVTLPGGAQARVVAGTLGSATGPVRPRPTEPLYLDLRLPADSRATIEVPDGHSVLLVTVRGEVLVGGKRTRMQADQIAQLTRTGNVELGAGAEPAQLLLVAGRPLREQIAHYGPFVMNTREEIQQAIADLEAGRF